VLPWVQIFSEPYNYYSVILNMVDCCLVRA